MPAQIADIPNVNRGLLAKFPLEIERPGVYRWYLAFAVDGTNTHWRKRPTRHQRRREPIDVAAVKLRCRYERWITQPAKVVDVLLNAFVEYATGYANCGFAVAERIIRHSQAGRPVVV